MNTTDAYPHQHEEADEDPRLVEAVRAYQSALEAGTGSEADELAQVVGAEPTPEFAAMVAEEYRRLLEALGDEELRRLAAWKLEGYSDAEIAGRLGCALRTVARRIKLIRTVWGAELPADEARPGRA